MFLTEYDEKESRELFRLEGERIGKEIGKEEATLDYIHKLMNKTAQSFDEVCDMLDVPKEEQKKFKLLL